MNMLYLPHPSASFPSRSAHTIEHMKMCEAFTRHGVAVRMLYHCLPFSHEGVDLVERVRDFYGLRQTFPVVTLGGWKVRARWLRATHLDSASMAATTALYVMWGGLAGRLSRRDVIYSRNRGVAAALVWLLRVLPAARRPKVVYEVHEPEDHAFRLLAPGLAGIVTISEQLRDHLCVDFGVSRSVITVERCAVDTEQFTAATIPRADARRRLGLPSNGAPIVAYCGRIDASRGVDVLIRAARRFSEHGWYCMLIGGSADDARRLPGVEEIPPCVIFAGAVSPANVPVWLSAADVLVAPPANRGQYDRGASPLKLFEYMAAQRPIVSTRVPAVEKIVTDTEHAVLVEPGSPDDLVRGISWVLEHPCEARGMVARAWMLAERHTWVERARRILRFIDGLPERGAAAEVIPA